MSQSTLEYMGDVTNVRTVYAVRHPGLYDRVAGPFIAQWAKNHLVAAIAEHLHGKVDMGNILCSVSTDDGEVWDEPVMVFDHRVPYGPRRVAYANPVLYHPPDQDILWCFSLRCSLYDRDSEDSDLCAAYSVDGGRSWIQVELAMHYHLPLITCAGIVRVEDGQRVRYLLPAHIFTARHDPHGVVDHFVLESSSLLEWKLAGYIPQPESGPVFMHEGNIADGDAPGELKMVMRTATYDYKAALEPPIAYSTVSRDGGRTWSPGQPEPELHNTTSKAYYGRSADGTQVYVFSVGPRGERKGLGYKIKRPGEGWSEERVFFDANVKNSYPTLLEYEPGKFYAVWDSSTSPDQSRTLIRFGKFSTNK